MVGIKNFTMNMSGIVAQNDNSVGSFGVWFDSQAKALLVGSQDAFAAIFGTKSAIMTEFLDKLLPARVSFVFPATPLVVTSFTLVLSGVVAYDDNTVESFSFEVRDNDAVYKHIDTSNVTFDNLMRDATSNALIIGMFEDLVGATVQIMSESESSRSLSSHSSNSSDSTTILSHSSNSSSSDSSESSSSDTSMSTVILSHSTNSSSSDSTASTASVSTGSSSSDSALHQ